MAPFGLDPGAVAARVKAIAARPRIPSVMESILVGSLGFGYMLFACQEGTRARLEPTVPSTSSAERSDRT